MTYSEAHTFVQFAHALADAAGDVARQHFHTPPAVEYKGDSSPVTLADREVESAMRALIEAKYPDHGIFGEEHGKRNEAAPYQWVLDPIDGTRAFIAGYPLFTTLIGLAHDGVPVLGVIDQPLLRERWVGVRGEKTRYNDKLATARGVASLAHAVVATTSVDYFTPAQTKAFAQLKAQSRYTLLSGDAYAYAQLANGRLDLVVDAGLKPYDLCALVPVVEGAGGIITDWSGKKLTIASKGDVVAAANAELHATALKMLSVIPA